MPSPAEPASQNPFESPKSEAAADDVGERTTTGSLIVIFLTVFIDLLGFGMVLPLLPIYAREFATQHGLSSTASGILVGILMGSFSAMQFIFLPIWGRLSDQYGRRPIILIGLAGSVLFYGIFGVATVARSLVGLFIARIGAGIAGATISTAQAYIADTTTPETRARGMALIGAAFALGFTLGPSLGIVALAVGGELHVSPWPGYVAAGLSGCALLLAIFLLPESLRQDSTSAARPLFDMTAFRSALATPSLVPLLACSFIAVFAFGNLESTLSIQLTDIFQAQTAEGVEPTLVVRWLIDLAHWLKYDDPKDVRMIVVYAVFAYIGVILTIAQGVIVRRLAGVIHEGWLAIAGGIFSTVGFLLLALSLWQTDLTLLLIALAVEVTGFALINPSIQSLISRRSDPELQGGVLGLAQSCTSLARILGPAIALPLFEGIHHVAPYALGFTVMLGATFLLGWASFAGHDFPAAAKPELPLE